MDASEILPRRVNAKEVLTPQKGDVFIFPIADGTAKLSWRDQEFREPTLRRKITVGSEDLSGELQGEWEGVQPTETNSTWISEPPGIGKPLRGAESNVEQGGAEALNDFWSAQGDFHLSPSYWTSSSAICAQGRNIPNSTEIHWRLLECQCVPKSMRFLYRIHDISEEIFIVRGATQERRS